MFLKLYLLSLIVFLVLDLAWLGIIAKNLYKDQIGFLLADQVRWGAAILFYLLFIAGLVFFALIPSLKEGSWISALLYGGFFGLVCYATYDLTNLATLKGWPLKIVIYDLIWGTVISGVTCFTIFWITTYWKSYLN